MINKFNILHIEDAIADSELIVRELKRDKLDFNYLVVDTRDEYLNALDLFAPDIVLCDHALPCFNSLEALEILKVRALSIPFILITGVMSDEITNDIMQAGADDYILKDRLARLPHAVVSALEKYNFDKERKQLLYNVKETEALSQEALTNLSDKLLLATSAARIGIWEYNLQEDKFVADDVLFSLYGISSAAFDGRYNMWLQFVHPQDKERINREFKEAVRKLDKLDTEFRIVWQDGSVHFLKAVGSFQRDASGKPVRFLGTNQDVTLAKQAEHTIKDSEAKYRSLFENSLHAILLSTTDGHISAANPAACSMFQMTEEEICKTGRKGLVDATDLKLERFIEERRQSGNAKGELTYVRKDKSTFPGEVPSSVFKDAYSDERTSVIIRDITSCLPTYFLMCIMPNFRPPFELLFLGCSRSLLRT